MRRHGGRLSRRSFVGGASIGGLGLLAGCGRLPWQAPQSRSPATKLPRVGILVGPVTGVSAPAAAFRQGLADLGYTEGQDLIIELRVAEASQLPQRAAELAALPVDVLHTQGPAHARAARDATSTIPVVMSVSGDPVAMGLVASPARPGGNLTGVTTLVTQLTTKRLELLRETLPSMARLAILFDRWGADPSSELKEAEAAASLLGIQLLPLEVRTPQDLEMAFEAAVQEHADALLLLTGLILFENQPQVVDLAARHQLPAMYTSREFMRSGGLMSYGSSQSAQSRRAAYYVDRILKGARPADLPVEQPMTFDFVVNLKTARDLGLTFPNEIMLQVTEAIQ